MRYFQPKEYQYVSQYTPAMMELDYRKGQELLKQEDAFSKDLFDASNNYIIRNPGHLSKQEDVDKANNFFKSNLDKISTEVNSGKLNAREGVNRIKQLSDFYKTDKSVQGLLMDSQATWGEKGFEAQRSTGKLKQGVGAFGPQGRPGSVYIDESNNLHVEKADASQLKDLVGAGAYGVEIPKNALEKYKEFYSYIKPETIAQEIERPGFSINKDGQNYVYSTNKGSFTREEVTRQALRNLATPFVNANMETNPDYEWDRRINMTDVYGFDAAKEKEIDRVVDSFPGYYKKEETKDEATINPFGSTSSEADKKKREIRTPGVPNANPEKTIGVDINDFIQQVPVKLPSSSPLTMGTENNKKLQSEPIQIFNLPEDKRRIALEYAKQNPKWENIVKNPNKRYNDLNSFYSEMNNSEYFKNLQKHIVRSNTTVTPINPGADDWKQLFGDNNTVSLEDLTTNSNFANTRFYNLQDKKYYTPQEIIKKKKIDAKQPISNVGEYHPENAMNVFLPEKLDSTKPIQLNINGEQYVGTSPFVSDSDEQVINTIYNTIFKNTAEKIKLQLPGNKTITFDVKFHKADKKREESFDILDQQGNVVNSYSNATEAYYTTINQFLK